MISNNLNLTVNMAVPWLRRLIAGLSPRRPGLAPRSIQWDLWWTKWHWDRFFSESFGFPVNIIPPWDPHFQKFKKIVLSLIHPFIHPEMNNRPVKVVWLLHNTF
jgi:hypothetical protein